MRKIIYYIVVINLLLLSACEEDVNIKSNFEKTYLLNCLLNADSTFQVAYLAASFDVDGYDPDSYDGDPFVKGATIQIYDGGNVYDFQESQIDSLPGFEFNHPITIYTLDNYQPQNDRYIRIQAFLPDGGMVYAEQVTMKYRFTSLPFYGKSIPDSDPHEDLIEFKTLHNYENFYFVPKLKLVYEYALNPGVKNRVEVPFDFTESNEGVLQPVYPNIMREVSFNYNREILETTMDIISQDEPMKSRFTFNRPTMTLLILNDDLAAYYSSENFINDNYSIVVSASEYSNVVGGKGIFGSYGTVTGKISMYVPFVEGMGYHYNGRE